MESGERPDDRLFYERTWEKVEELRTTSFEFRVKNEFFDQTVDSYEYLYLCERGYRNRGQIVD